MTTNDEICLPWSYQFCKDQTCAAVGTYPGISFEVEETNTVEPSVLNGLPMLLLTV